MINRPMVVNIKDTDIDFDVYIGRGSIWGNPFHIRKDRSRKTVIEQYEKYLLCNKQLMKRLPELKGKVLGCYCKPLDCHGDVLLRMANKPREI